MPASPLEHVCAVLWHGCSPYGSRDTENLLLSSFLSVCQALLFLLHPFPSLSSVRELTMLSCLGVLSPPPLPHLSMLPSFPYITLSPMPLQFLMEIITFFFFFEAGFEGLKSYRKRTDYSFGKPRQREEGGGIIPKLTVVI